MEDKFHTIYTASSCNRTPHSADWGVNKLICYATSNAVAIYDPKYAQGGKVLFMLCGHKDRINGVRWLRNKDIPESELISVSSDHTAIVWTKISETTFRPAVLRGHLNVVTVADGLLLENQESSISAKLCAIIATASTDSTVRIWKRNSNEDEFGCIQILSFGSGFCLAVRFTFLPGTDKVLLACAADDAKIHLFVENVYNKEADKKYMQLISLVGHDDWIRAMDFAVDDSGTLLLASGSQDALIRLWKIMPHDKESSLRKYANGLSDSEDIHTEEKVFCVKTEALEFYFAVSLDSVLAGHEGWIYGIDWHPRINLGDGEYHQPMKLLSSSLDKTMIIWEPDSLSGIWMESVRVGELGGNTLGFYGSKFGPIGQSIMGHGYQGSFHLWSYSKEMGSWLPDVTVGGHFAEVTDLQWEPGGQFLLSVSADQTTRLHAPWVQDNQSEVTWHEIARPQVHGYDMSCLAILSRYRFVSGAEEKVIRAFEAPNNFMENFHRICNIKHEKLQNRSNVNAIPQGASVPALGLSNKAVYNEDKELLAEDRHVKDEYPEFYFVALELKEPPTEENLLQNTLWPEVHKLYGHGYEIFALASRNDGSIFASSCKATTAEHAAIILWDVTTWKQIQKLTSHQLTVTQMSFSPDDRFLLSVSRDRKWTLFEQEKGNEAYRLVAATDKKNGIHTRIIWCCCWTHDSEHFFTGSRDGKLCVWGKCGSGDSSLGDYALASDPLELSGQSITAVAAAPHYFSPGTYLVALGLEIGHILLYKWSSKAASDNWQKCLELKEEYAHHLTIKRLAFRPLGENTDTLDQKPGTLQLASCGSDHAVKIYNIYVNRLCG